MREYAPVRDAITGMAVIADRPPDFVVAAPGRINLIGEHVDAYGGAALPAAIDRCIGIAVRRRDDRRIVAMTTTPGVRPARAEIDPAGPVADAPGWTRAVHIAVSRACARAGETGFDVVVASDLPVGAGLSSSAALCCGLAAAIDACAGGAGPGEAGLVAPIPADGADHPLPPGVRRAQEDEQAAFGVRCGLLDPAAVLVSRRDHVVHLDTARAEAALLPADFAGARLAAIDSGMPRRLAETPYNRRIAEAATAARRLGLPVEALATATDADVAGLMRDDPSAGRRARHIVTEHRRVGAAVGAIRQSDWPAVGRLLAESHASLRNDFEVSTPELDAIVAIASATPGVLGARLVGAGFGGSVLVLADSDAAVTAVAARLAAGYRPPSGSPAARLLRLQTADGATFVDPAGRTRG
jgi:galactokinase